MKTFQFEARHSPTGGNWGKFLVAVPDTEWEWRSGVDGNRPLLRTIGWSPGFIWVHDLQTGEACIVYPGGSAHADLQKHRVHLCPLFEPWLEWLYGQLRGYTNLTDRLAALPKIVDLPHVPFAERGYRRPGPR